jgi:hypothetical protein
MASSQRRTLASVLTYSGLECVDTRHHGLQFRPLDALDIRDPSPEADVAGS